MRRGGERPDARQGLHRDARGSVHADVHGDQVRVLERCGFELLQRKIEAQNLEALALQPGGGLRQRERLPPQLVGIDQYGLAGAGYLDFGRASNGADPGSRLAPARSRRWRYSCHSFSRFWPSQYRYSQE